ncbi:hypothetical protein Tsubulata_016592 [Turnera subulata]|uniref:Uncharacterized protein n=1 Tax=Turnera subulata TaxID=218843 RepID=A0A9Q0G769_9ROSI|nr:hypothetical protein Tsubulata_016592 [Turnera subulata]
MISSNQLLPSALPLKAADQGRADSRCVGLYIHSSFFFSNLSPQIPHPPKSFSFSPISPTAAVFSAAAAATGQGTTGGIHSSSIRTSSTNLRPLPLSLSPSSSSSLGSATTCFCLSSSSSTLPSLSSASSPSKPPLPPSPPRSSPSSSAAAIFRSGERMLWSLQNNFNDDVCFVGERMFVIHTYIYTLDDDDDLST